MGPLSLLDCKNSDVIVADPVCKLDLRVCFVFLFNEDTEMVKLKPLYSLLLAVVVTGVTSGREPAWSGRVIETGPARQLLQQTPLLLRPNRPFHFYGNTVRRLHYRGRLLPTRNDVRQSLAALSEQTSLPNSIGRSVLAPAAISEYSYHPNGTVIHAEPVAGLRAYNDVIIGTTSHWRVRTALACLRRKSRADGNRAGQLEFGVLVPVTVAVQPVSWSRVRIARELGRISRRQLRRRGL